MSNSTEVRKRRRGRRKGSGPQGSQNDEPGRTEPDGSPETEHQDSKGVDAEEARFRLLFMMQLRGCSQKKMAQHFGVTTRTIRNWLPKLAGLKLPILENIDPNDEVGRILCRYAVRETELLEWKCAAETDRDYRVMIAISKELRLLEKSRCDFLDRIGLFHGLRLPDLTDDDRSARQAEFLLGSIHSLLAFDTPPPEDDAGEAD